MAGAQNSNIQAEMANVDDEYYGNIQDIEDLIQREMQELNKMQEVVNKKRSTLNDMGVQLGAPQELDDSGGLLDVLNSSSPAKKSRSGTPVASFSQGLKSPLAKDMQKLNKVTSESPITSSQVLTYRFGQPKIPEITIKPNPGGVDFVGKNKEQISALEQKKKTEKVDREKSLSKKRLGTAKIENLDSKQGEKIDRKPAVKIDTVAASKSKVGALQEVKRIGKVSETHIFEEESAGANSKSRSVSRNNSKVAHQPTLPTFEMREQQASSRSKNPVGSSPAQPNKSGFTTEPKQPSPLTKVAKPAPPKTPSHPAVPTPAPATSTTPKPRQKTPNPKPHPDQPASSPKPQPQAAPSQPQPSQKPSSQPAPKPSKPASFRPDTMDLFSKLEEYSKYKENLDLMNRQEEVAAVGGVFVREAERDVRDGKESKEVREGKGKEAKEAGEFLRKKISSGFGKNEGKAVEGERGYSSRVLKERSPSVKNGVRTGSNMQIDLSPKRSARGEKNYSSRVSHHGPASPGPQKTPRINTPQKSYLAKSIDLKKVVEPRYKKEKVEIAPEPSFQPMLSRKSLIMAEKMGYNGEKLWASKTPTKSTADGRRGSQDHSSVDNQAKNHSPWMSRMVGGADHPDYRNSPGAPSFQPKICEKSKQIDQYKQRGQGQRHEVLHQLGMEQNLKLQRKMREKAKEEDEEIKAMSFHPKTGHNTNDSFFRSGVGIADRNEQWAIRKEERIQRLKESQMKVETEQCSFKPKLVRLAMNQAAQRGPSRNGDVSYQTETNHMDTQYYSSAFVQDGMKNFFTRLEQARRRKKEDIERLGRFSLKQKTGADTTQNLRRKTLKTTLDSTETTV